MDDFKCVNCARYLFNDPIQCPCGDRICGDCFPVLKYKARGGQTWCPGCQEEISLRQCFRDRAAENELKTATIKCSNQEYGCLWEGSGLHYQEHIERCRYTKVPCPNKEFGCPRQLLQNEVGQHLNNGCCFIPVECPWCSKKVHNKGYHIKKECGHVVVSCPNGCGDRIPKKDVGGHMRTVCTHQIRDCTYKSAGCQFKGKSRDLSKHYKKQSIYHNQLLAKAAAELAESVATTQLEGSIKSDATNHLSEIDTKLDSVMRCVEISIQQLRKDVALEIKSLQATSYDGTFIWKIPEVQRRRDEARSGKMVSLYSVPFYTSRYGYKMCLRLYMDGDGSGKGTHLSLFLTLMKGEYDDLLTWPFGQTVTLMLLDQKKQKDIFRSFRPDPSSDSFQQPINEMNVASGCPKFAPLSILENPSYVKNDTMYFKVDTNPLSICLFAPSELSVSEAL